MPSVVAIPHQSPSLSGGVDLSGASFGEPGQTEIARAAVKKMSKEDARTTSAIPHVDEDGKACVVTVPIAEYMKAKLSDRKKLSYGDFVTPNNRYIKDLAEHVAGAPVEGSRQISERAIYALLRFVNGACFYDTVEANGSKELIRYPIETLIERTGDCEDTAILYASLAKALGADVALLLMADHVAIGLAGNFSGTYYAFNGKKYFYLEATSRSEPSAEVVRNFHIGKVPEGSRGAKAAVFPIDGKKHSESEMVAPRSTSWISCLFRRIFQT